VACGAGENLKDLRDWIKALDAADLLYRHPEKIDARNCSDVIFQNHMKASLFEKVLGFDSPLIANSISSRRMMALALETSEQNILEEYRRRISEPIQPVFSKNTGRCQENATLSNPDLTRFPILLQHELDGAPYITAGVVVAKDPETSSYNIGIYRLMFRTKNELGINITAPHKLRWIYQKNFEKGRPLEIAICLGLHPLDLLAAVTSSQEVNELALWGGLQGEPIKLVKCKSVDLHVPDHAEIVLEGVMEPTGWTEPEGMYGEFPGTYSGMRKNPIIKIKAITTRKDCIYQSATHGGEHLARSDFFVIIPQIELSIFQALKSAGIDARQVRILEESAGMICFVSIEVRAAGDSRNALAVALAGSRQNFPKYCTIVDSDIDVFDNEAVAWAVATRTQPKEDALILEGLRIPSSSDPSLSAGTRTMSKLGIDATIPFGADRFKFLHSKVPKTREYPVQKTSVDADKMIIDYLKQSGPSFFYDVASSLQGPSFRDILLSWGTLRESKKIEQGMDGKYSAVE
jgi:2,5-furandicarboxylate decarboxylase 1